MKSMYEFWMNESGSEGAEYTIITGAVAIAILVAIVAFGAWISGKINEWRTTADGQI